MRKFLIKLSYTVFPLWILVVGLVLYTSLYVDKQSGGDIGSLLLIPFGNDYNQMLEEKTINKKLYRTINSIKELKTINTDVLTIGDSFSQQNNSGYQNYLSNMGMTVINCNSLLYDSPFLFAYNILDKGIVDSTNTKVLVLERVEREMKSEINKFDFKNNKEKWDSELTIDTNHVFKSKNKWSITRVRDMILYKISQSKSPVYTANLDRDFFSSDEPRKLYFYHHDIMYGANIDIKKEKNPREVFDILQTKAKEKGISLILLVAVDKYDLYQNHIEKNPFPLKTINEDLVEAIGETPSLLITKDYLAPLIEKGEKDVFKFTDTHWSYKASKVVANELFNRIRMMNATVNSSSKKITN